MAAIGTTKLDAYMFPVFFPLSGGGGTFQSYDARADRLLQRICLDLGRDKDRCAEIPRS